MVTLISHFYNEEYLLPYWIEHHKKYFKDAILIDHGSTDSSRKLIEELAPNWQVIDSELDEFDPLLTDFEVQKIEYAVKGWKIVLNTTEFLVGDLQAVIEDCDLLGVKAVIPKARIMVDIKPNELPIRGESLITQKPYGFNDTPLYDLIFRGKVLIKLLKFIYNLGWFERGRSRLLHSFPIGGYTIGRHNWIHKAKKTDKLKICWFGYSPWNEAILSRKLSFEKKLPKEDMHFGAQHRKSKSVLQQDYLKNRQYYKFFGNDKVI